MFPTPLPTLMLGPDIGFAIGTRVHTNEGLKPIESIRVGDWVLTHSDESPPPRRRRQRSEYQYGRVTRSTSVDVQSLACITLHNFADGMEDTLLVATGQPGAHRASPGAQFQRKCLGAEGAVQRSARARVFFGGGGL